jgi:gamma-glutamylcyclotransferase (GGCT)/AIG2-like uncharacterized protein YtfP
MQHRVFVYGTLLRGEGNHGLLAGAEFLGEHRTEPRFSLLQLGAYPGLISRGGTAVRGEVYRVNDAGLRRLDRLEDYPRLYDRTQLPTPFGRAWVYLYRGSITDRRPIGSGDWRSVSRTGPRATAIRTWRDPKNPGRRKALQGGH